LIYCNFCKGRYTYKYYYIAKKIMKKYTLILSVFIFAFMLFGFNFNIAKAATTPAPDCVITSTLRVGSTGDEVACLQAHLGLSADGKFGKKTKAAVLDFQLKRKLSADGVLGVKSRTELENDSLNTDQNSSSTTTTMPTLPPVECLGGPGAFNNCPPPPAPVCTNGFNPVTGFRCGCTSNLGFSTTTGESCGPIPTTTSPLITSVVPNRGTTNDTITVYGTNLYVADTTASGAVGFYNVNNHQPLLIGTSTFAVSPDGTSVKFMIAPTLTSLLAPGTYGIAVETPAQKYSNILPFTITGPVCTNGFDPVTGFRCGCTSNLGFSTTTGESCGVTQTLTITTPSPLPNATVGNNYNATISVTGGVGAYTWGNSSGSLPLGLSYSYQSQGGQLVISGIPTVAGTYNFSMTVSSGSNFATKQFTLTVNPATIPTVSPIIISLIPAGCTTNIGFSTTTGEKCSVPRTSANDGDRVEVYGTNFTNLSGIVFGNTSPGNTLLSVDTNTISSTLLGFRVPSGMGIGTRLVSVKNGDSGFISNSVTLNLNASNPKNIVCEYARPPVGYHYEGTQPYPICGGHLVQDLSNGN
jgi:peptidoglycan hydrolase-like protein with peptidoglycan-binding domain